MAGQHATGFNPFMATGGAFSVAAGRLSFKYGLEGPCLSVDTACSSSLVALNIGVSDIRVERIQSSVFGGVNITLTQIGHTVPYASGMLAQDGRCKTLDATADGYTRGEACCAMTAVSYTHLTLPTTSFV